MKKNSHISDAVSEGGIFSWLDIHFARFISGLAGKETRPEIALAAALVSRHQRQGHICLDLGTVAGKPVGDDPRKTEPLCPALGEWVSLLRACDVVGRPGEYTPLVLDDKHRLYLYRYWEYQEKLAARIREWVCAEPPATDTDLLRSGLDHYFPSQGSEETDWQKVAAFTALTRRFCVISGGPGTGKTTTVAKILALLLAQAGEKRLRIALAAPTGKAAARLQEAILREREKFDPALREAIRAEASTLHRLLGSLPDSPYFRHNEKNPLPTDVVVVDEASMVDLALMSKLVQALLPRTRLILLGDKDQLASVEAGAVLGDICDTGNVHRFSAPFCRTLKQLTGHPLTCAPDQEESSQICDSIVQLQISYRFGETSGIRRISAAINTGNGAEALQILRQSRYGDIAWKDLPRIQDLGGHIRAAVTRGFAPYLSYLNTPLKAFEAFEHFRILCALRQGPYGVMTLNHLAEAILEAEGLISPRRTWYPGRPVLITRNDYQLRLFNGDVGITLPDREAGGQLRVFFPGNDGTFRRISPLRLPDHETVYAMTVHKSQGSEFDRILLMLPDRDAPVLTRELLYTGITRAIHAVEVWGTAAVFRDAVARPIRRTSGLRDALWEKEARLRECPANMPLPQPGHGL